MTTERVITFTKDWPKQLSKHVISYLCSTCTMLVCCDKSAGCKLRQEIRQRDRDSYERRRAKVLRARKRAYACNPKKFKDRMERYRMGHREKARQATRAWRAAKKAEQAATV